MQNLQGKKVAILVTNGFEESELKHPKQKLESAGAEVHIVSPEEDTIKAWNDGNWGNSYKVTRTLDKISADDYDALVLPGGVINPDKLRREEKAVQFTRDFFKQGKPVASICHGPQMLIEAEVVNGRKMTSYPSIRTDLKNAGANWVDEPVVVDSGLVTSRSPEDLEDFSNKLIEEVAEGKHKEQAA